MPEPDSTSISLSFLYTKSDYVRTLRAHNTSRLNLPLDILSLVVLIGFGAIYWQSPSLHRLAVCAVALSVVIALMLVAAFTVIPALAGRGESKFFGITSFVFTSEDIHIRTSQFDSRIKWSVYSRVLISRHFYLLYSRSRQFTVVPKRVFKSVDQQIAFESLLAEQIPKIDRRGT